MNAIGLQQAIQTLPQLITSLKALLDGHNTRDAGESPDAVTIEEAFDDLQTEHHDL